MKQTIIVGLLGLSKSGKDTIGEHFVKHGFIRVAFGDMLKREYAEINNVSLQDLITQGIEKEKHRVKIIEYAEKKRSENPYYWIEKAIAPFLNDKGQIEEGLKLVFTDIRRDKEIDWFEELKSIQFHTQKYDRVHYITTNLFLVERLGNLDLDNLTHETIGYAKGISKHSPFPLIDSYIKNDSSLENLENKTIRIIETYSF
jgi:hypothetical protein